MDKPFQDPTKQPKLVEKDAEQVEVLAMLSEQLQTFPPVPQLLDNIEKRLEIRIQDSIAKHAGLHTVRAKEGIWKELMRGIRYKPLWDGPLGNSVLVEFAPGSALPLHRHHYLEEGIILSGGLQLDDLDLAVFDYHVSPIGSRHGRIQSKQGAVAYLRGTSLGQPLSMAKEVLGGLLPAKSNESVSIFNQDNYWVEIQKGLFQKDLWTDGTIASRYFRLDPGTTIEGHFHPLDEEYMMLSGEIFLGDILVQAGDYHLAPAGTSHLDIVSETGAMLYVRGAA